MTGGGPDYLHPLAQPVVLVPLWAAQAAAGIGSGVTGELVETAAAAGAIGYYAVRLQDDLMDEGIGDPAAIAVLSSAVLTAAQSTLGSMGLSARFWSWHREVMLGYAEAMQFEAEIRYDPDAYDEAAFERVLERSRPLAVPGVAVLDAAGAWSLQPDFERMILSATGALQIVNDLDQVAKDLAEGNRTWVHNLLGLHAGAPLTRGRFIGGMDRVLDEMRDRLAEVGWVGRPTRRARGGGVGGDDQESGHRSLRAGASVAARDAPGRRTDLALPQSSSGGDMDEEPGYPNGIPEDDESGTSMGFPDSSEGFRRRCSAR